MIGLKRPAGAVAIAGILLLVDVVVRLLVGGPYLGAAALLLASCGLALLGFLPPELARPSFRVAALPAVALTSFSILLTTVSIAGIPLSETSIRLSVALLVVGCAVADQVVSSPETPWPRHWKGTHEAALLVALLGIVGFGLASAWDIVGPFTPRGTDWGHYLLYADEVESQRALLIEDRFGSDHRLFVDSPAVGAVYGGALILDGAESRSLSSGIVIVSAAGLLGVFALVGALWGVVGGVAAGAAYAVAPIRLEPLYWYGLHTLLALVVLPFVLLALGLMYRGRRDWRTVALLGFSLVGIAVAHTTSALVVGVLIAVVLVLGTGASVLKRWTGGSPPTSDATSRGGIVFPVIAGVTVAFVVGAGVIVHLRRQAADLGAPVSYRLFEPDWLDLETIVNYYSWPFLGLVAVSTALVLAAPRLRRDPALLTVLTLALAGVVVSQLWRVHFPFEYRRAVYYVGLAMVILVGVAATVLRRRVWIVVAYLLVLAYVAHGSIGFRLPERLLTRSNEPSPAATALEELRRELDREEYQGAVVADRCLHFVVPYLLRRRTFAAFEEWQVAFVDRVPLARKAAAIVAGGPRGKRLAKNLGVRYIVADPRCTPDPAPGLGGVLITRNEEISVIRLPSG